jgi:hypothetical protein
MKLKIAWILLSAGVAYAQAQSSTVQSPPPIDQIMQRVGENQEKSVEARRHYVYKQEVLIAIRRSNGKVACQGKREYTVAPGPKGVTRTLVANLDESGECDKDSKQSLSASADSGMADGLGGPVGWEKDGVPRDLFPLAAHVQKHYDYRFVGMETYRGRPAYRIAFQPKQPREEVDAGDWKGEALIDAAEFQPISVTTTLAQKVPAAVRILLGTNVRGLGFSVNYERVADGVWFPSGFGGEFSLNVLFFYRRSVSINLKNSEFKHTDVNSDVAFEKIQ